MFGGDESYDREGDGPAGGTPRDPSEEPAAAQQHPADQDPESTEDPAGPEEAAGPAEPAAVRPAERVAAMPPPEPTGDERVDAVMARLAELDGAPVADHVEVFEDVQYRLQDVLASIDHEEIDHEEEEAPGARPSPPGGQS